MKPLKDPMMTDEFMDMTGLSAVIGFDRRTKGWFLKAER
jgi:hypothetical protein